MTDNKQLIRATYTNEAYGDIRTIYNLETDEVLFCARDVAKGFGYADPSRSVRDICVNLIKEAHITDGGLQVLNFVRRYDVVRLFKHSRSENCYDFFFTLEAIANDFAENVFDRYIDNDGDDGYDDDEPFECFGDCEDCPHYDECAADDEYEDDITSPEFREFLAEHTTDPVDEKRPYIGFLIQSIEEINNCLEDKGVFIAKAEIFSDNKPAYSLVKMGVEGNA